MGRFFYYDGLWMGQNHKGKYPCIKKHVSLVLGIVGGWKEDLQAIESIGLQVEGKLARGQRVVIELRFSCL